MILYLDTSSLLKLYVVESGTGEVQSRVEGADVVATSIIAYPEAHAALARRHREGALTRTEFRTVLERFRDSWVRFLALLLLPPLPVKAGGFGHQASLSRHGCHSSGLVRRAPWARRPHRVSLP